MKRDQLLDFLNRALDLVPKSRLAELGTGLVSPCESPTRGARKERPLAKTRSFHAAVLRGDYYESFNVNSKNFMDLSEGTLRFIHQLRRRMQDCVDAAATEPGADVREAFELLRSLLRRLDNGDDEFVFFADEAGSWQVGVDWQTGTVGTVLNWIPFRSTPFRARARAPHASHAGLGLVNCSG